jgi:hypothetical protein
VAHAFHGRSKSVSITCCLVSFVTLWRCCVVVQLVHGGDNLVERIAWRAMWLDTRKTGSSSSVDDWVLCYAYECLFCLLWRGAENITGRPLKMFYTNDLAVWYVMMVLLFPWHKIMNIFWSIYSLVMWKGTQFSLGLGALWETGSACLAWEASSVSCHGFLCFLPRPYGRGIWDEYSCPVDFMVDLQIRKEGQREGSEESARQTCSYCVDDCGRGNSWS